ncbi:MAG: transpeptidase family protein [Bacteroidetes bacterium]|nr:transpeptidase family protein [Bacteroidota bacterium]
MNNKRALAVLLLIICFFVALIVRLFNIQIKEHANYKAAAERQQNSSVKLKAERGLIKDRNLEVLAYTQNDVSIYADTRMLSASERGTIASKMSKAFKKSKDHYLNLINSASGNICLEEKVLMNKIEELNKPYIDGFFISEDFTRKYPYGSLASHVLGFVSEEKEGVAGIANYYNDELKGIDGIKFIENDVIGRTVSVNDRLTQRPQQGNTTILTIDYNLQKILEIELKSGLKEYQGEWAVGIIMDPNDGEILALANFPDYDPSNYNLFDNSSLRNRAVTDTYEPGSTIKPIILSILFEEKLANENEIINTENGVYSINKVKIRDTHKFSSLSVSGVLKHSSNIGMAKLSSRVQPDVFFKYLRNYGFGNISAIDLPGEAAGLLKKPTHYSVVSQPFMSFGYEISVTPIQLITAFSALINGGYLYKPHLVKSITDPTGNVIREFKPERIRKVVSEKTSDRIKKLMLKAVEEGTGRNARLTNVFAGGKTGTSQKLVNGSYSSENYNSSFIGYFPAEKPEYIILVLISSPKIGKYGGYVAAPVFKNIAQQIVESDILIAPDENKIKQMRRPIDAVLVDIKKESANPSVFATSNLSPESNNNQKNNSSFTPGIMPNLINDSMRDAVSKLNNAGIEYKIIGSGRVVSQSIQSGSKINKGLVCLIKCESVKNISNLRIN